MYKADATCLDKPMGSGIRMTRDAADRPPCETCPKIPKGRLAHPSSAVELSDKNLMAYRHYKECKAVGQFPDDAIVRRNAAIISDIVEDYRQKPMRELLMLLPILTKR